jgi:hypothetical protein
MLLENFNVVHAADFKIVSSIVALKMDFVVCANILIRCKFNNVNMLADAFFVFFFNNSKTSSIISR